MRKSWLISVACLLLTACVYSRFIVAEMPNGEKVRLRTAITQNEFVRGLSRIEEPANCEGMLFLKKHSETVSFWMFQMKFPLDLVYLDKNKMVKELYPAQPACVENQECPVVTSKTDNIRYILELKAGAAEKYGLKIGTKIKW